MTNPEGQHQGRGSGTNGFVIVAALVLLGGIAAGVAWALVASPAQWEFTGSGWRIGETAIADRFSVVAWFSIIGVLASAVITIGLERLLPDTGWPILLLALGASALASVITWRIGVLFGPTDYTQLADLEAGRTAPESLAVGSLPPFLLWPLTAVAVVLVAELVRSGREFDQEIEFEYEIHG